MHNYQYNIEKESGKIIITGLHFPAKFVEVPRERRFERLYSYVLIKIDLRNSLKYLEESLKTDDLIIKEGMFRIALILYIKCFNNSGGWRAQLSLNKIYSDTHGEPIDCYNKFKKMRDKYIVHDENDFLTAKLGLVLNENEKKIVGIAYPEAQAKFDYSDNLKILYTLCKIALEKTETLIDEQTSKVEEYLMERTYDIVCKYSEMSIDVKKDNI